MKKVFVILGEVAVLVISYILGAVFIPGQVNTQRIVSLRWLALKADPNIIENFHIHTIFIMVFFSLFYAMVCIYLVFWNKGKMPGKEFGTSALISPSVLNKALADLNNKPNDPMNMVVTVKKYNMFERLILNFKHRKDD